MAGALKGRLEVKGEVGGCLHFFDERMLVVPCRDGISRDHAGRGADGVGGHFHQTDTEMGLLIQFEGDVSLCDMYEHRFGAAEKNKGVRHRFFSSENTVCTRDGEAIHARDRIETPVSA